MATSKKDYVAIAKIIRTNRDNVLNVYDFYEEQQVATATLDETAKDLAFYFEQDNPRFVSDGFLHECGVDV